MASTRSVKSPGIFASLANTTIPPTPIQGVSYRNESLAPAEVAEGWPYFQKVDSADFNQEMFQYTSMLDIMDKQGVLGWSDQVNYAAFALALGSNGFLYVATQASGPASTVRDPLVSPGFWFQYGSHGMVILSTLGVSDWAVPAHMRLGITKPKVTVIGAGGGASRAAAANTTGNGGAGGGTSIKVVDLTGITTVSTTIGAGGAGVTGASTGAGSPGGATSFGAIMSATGGAGGPALNGRSAGGIGSSGDINLRGQSGVSSSNGGNGGSSYFSPGAVGVGPGAAVAASSEGENANGYGAGGSAGNAFSVPGTGAGGNGAQGAIIVEW